MAQLPDELINLVQLLEQSSKELDTVIKELVTTATIKDTFGTFTE
jgi:hypothetical protein